MCSIFKISPVEYAHVNPLQNLPAVNSRIQFRSAVYKPIFLNSDYSSVREIIGTRILNCNVNTNRCINLQVGFTTDIIPLVKGTPNEPIVKGLKLMEDDYSKTTTDTPAKKMDYSLNIIRCKATSYRHIILLPYTQSGSN